MFTMIAVFTPVMKVQICCFTPGEARGVCFPPYMANLFKC